MRTRRKGTVGLAGLAALLLAGCASQSSTTTEQRWSDRIGGWSPNGKLVVFLSNRPDQRQWDLYVENADGHNPRRLTDDKRVERYPVFLSNRTVGFTVAGNAYALTVGGLKRRRLQRETTHLPVQTTVYYGDDPITFYIKAFSPDHRWIAYSAKGSHFTLTVGGVTSGGDWIDVWLKRSNGSGRRPLFKKLPEFDGEPQWSPDSRYVALDAVAGQGRQVYVVRVPSGKPQRLSHDAVSCCPRWTRDGRELLYQAPDGSFVLVHPNGSGEHVLSHDIRVRKLAVSPDETKAFFEETEGYLTKVGILDLSSGETLRLTED